MRKNEKEIELEKRVETIENTIVEMRKWAIDFERRVEKQNNNLNFFKEKLEEILTALRKRND